MKFLPGIGFILFCALAALFGQDEPLPKAETQDPFASPTPLPSPPPQLIPADVLAPAERAASPASTAPTVLPIPQLDQGFNQGPISPQAANAQARAEWRDLKNRVANDPEIRAALRRANAARTDLEKRQLLRDYYTLYFGKMIALAARPEMKAYLNDRKNEHMGSLPQPRVRPSPSPAKSKTQ